MKHFGNILINLVKLQDTYSDGLTYLGLEPSFAVKDQLAINTQKFVFEMGSI